MPKTHKRTSGQKGSTSPNAHARSEPQKRRQHDRGIGLRGRQGLSLYLGMAGAALAGAAVVFAAFLLLAQIGKPASTSSPDISSSPSSFGKSVGGGRLVPDQGRDHVVPGQAHPPYNSNPPTSGWHYDKAAPWGIHDKPVDDETQVHNLEHGGLLIQYWCPNGCSDLVDKLKVVANRYPSKVVLAPYGKPLPNRVALTAWNWLETFDEFDEQRIVSFIAAHKNQGPEQVPD